MNKMKIQNQIKDRMTGLGLKQKDLSIATGFTEGTVSAHLSGARGLSLKAVRKYSEVLKFKVEI